jgi:hypothetical protein
MSVISTETYQRTPYHRPPATHGRSKTDGRSGCSYRVKVRPHRNRLAVTAGQSGRAVGGRPRRVDFSALLVNLSQLMVTRPEIRLDGQRPPRVLERSVEVSRLKCQLRRQRVVHRV